MHAYAAAGFTKTLGAMQQSGTIVATAHGRVLSVRQGTLPLQAFDERELFEVLESPRAREHAA